MQVWQHHLQLLWPYCKTGLKNCRDMLLNLLLIRVKVFVRAYLNFQLWTFLFHSHVQCAVRFRVLLNHQNRDEIWGWALLLIENGRIIWRKSRQILWLLVICFCIFFYLFVVIQYEVINFFLFLKLQVLVCRDPGTRNLVSNKVSGIVHSKSQLLISIKILYVAWKILHVSDRFFHVAFHFLYVTQIFL